METVKKKVYKINHAGIKLMHDFEGLYLTAYQDSAGIWTIGRGTIRYKGGKWVKKGDVISLEYADELFVFDLQDTEEGVNKLVPANLTDNQYSALVSFAYNVGCDIDTDKIAEGLGDSTLLKKINLNPNDPSIREEFYKWKNAGGKPVRGLLRRRKAEADLYFTK